MTALQVIQREIGPCREWPPGNDVCGAPSEYVLWGKLIPAEGLGPRCAECAAKHVGWRALGDPSWAISDLASLAREVGA